MFFLTSFFGTMLEDWPQMRKIQSLTAMQDTKVNALAPESRAKALDWFSPRQCRSLRDYS